MIDNTSGSPLNDCEHVYKCTHCCRDMPTTIPPAIPPGLYLQAEVETELSADEERYTITKGPISIVIHFNPTGVHIGIWDRSDEDLCNPVRWQAEYYADCLEPEKKEYFPSDPNQYIFFNEALAYVNSPLVDEWVPELEMDETPEPPLDDGD